MAEDSGSRASWVDLVRGISGLAIDGIIHSRKAGSGSCF